MPKLRRRTQLILLAALAVAQSAVAQSAVAQSAVAQEVAAPDAPSRSQLARTAFRRAAQSERAGAPDSAYADLIRAQAAWPEQPAYTETLARWAARRGDSTVLVRALELLGRQGTGSATARDSAVRRIATGSASIASRLAALETALAPVDRGAVRLVSPDTMFWPEGLDADPRDGTLYVTSMRHRNVLVVPAAGDTTWVFRSGTPLPSAVMGVALDPTRDLLWLTTAGHRAMQGYAPPDSSSSELLRVRDGVIERRWRLGDGAGIPGELAVAPDGEVVVSDAARGRLYRLRPDRDSLEIVTDPLLRSVQGIAFSADGSLAWIADWSHGLLRWDRASGRFSHVAAAGGATLLGIDGLRRAGDRLIAVQNGVAPARVIEVSLSPDGTRATAVRVLDRPAELPGEPTVGAVVGDRFVYVASSHWPFWDDDLKRIGTASLPAVVLRSVLIPR